MPYRRYTVAEKLEICECAKATSNHHAAARYSVDRKRIREWLQEEDALRSQRQDAYRLSGGGRKLTSEELEAILLERIFFERSNKNRVTRTMIVDWGIELAEELDVELGFSHGWLDGYLSRHELVLRAVTNKPTLTLEETVDRAVSFVLHLKALVREYQVTPENIWCLDETALFFDHDRGGTIERRGARHVLVTF